MDPLAVKIADKSARLAIIGLGYVGLPLAVGFARAGYQVLGLDVDERKVAAVNEGRSYIQDVEGSDVMSMVKLRHLSASSDYDMLFNMDAILICVPTPFDSMKAPDLTYIAQAARGISSRLRAGQLIILQSTTFPGTTEEFVLPILEESGLQGGQDFHLAFSPERINPGDKEFTVENTPKVVGGLTPRCTELARSLLAQLFAQVHVVSSPRSAEMSKLLENIFRSVNIALVNELALLSERMGIDLWRSSRLPKPSLSALCPSIPVPVWVVTASPSIPTT
jgi:UDP-N-acetyl-D-glucosamine dehydrogenase